ncbi:MAG: nicotinate-nicotinamide nucleotide adenylyltransferase [Oscillospiraceae bacterium]
MESPQFSAVPLTAAYGHYEMLRSLETTPILKKLCYCPTVYRRIRCAILASDSDRINMCRLLTSDFKKAALCLIEFEREGKATIDTVRLLKRKYPQKSFAFVCGGDMLISFDKWYKYEELLREIPFIVFRREGCDGEEFDRRAEYFISLGMDLTVPTDKIPAVSSTFIRNNAEKAREYLPKPIYEYIKNGGIYRV